MNFRDAFKFPYDFDSKTEYGELDSLLYFISDEADNDSRKHREYAAQIDYCLAVCSADRWEITGNRKDLAKAMTYGQRALSLMQGLKSPITANVERWLSRLTKSTHGTAHGKGRKARIRAA